MCVCDRTCGLCILQYLVDVYIQKYMCVCVRVSFSMSYTLCYILLFDIKCMVHQILFTVLSKSMIYAM